MNATDQAPGRLNIGLVTPGFSADEADWCIPALLNLVRRLAAVHDVTVYTLRYPHHDGSYGISGARVRAFGGATIGGWQRLPLLRRAISCIIKDARRKPFSLLHGMWADEAGLVAAVAARRTGVPSLVSLMGGELVRLPDIAYGVQLSRSGRWMTHLSLRLANLISAGSQQLLDQAARLVARERLRFLPLGVDLSLFKPHLLPASYPPYRIVHAASLSAVKDQATLLAAFAQAREVLAADMSLHLAGAGPMRQVLAAQASELAIADRVRFHGALSHERLPGFYRQGHLFALSSRHESQSMAFLEAAACGLPAVGTAVGLLAQHLPPACVAPVGDAYALAQAMVRLLDSDEKRLEEGRRLQALVRTEYGLVQTIGRLEKVYDELVQSRG